MKEVSRPSTDSSSSRPILSFNKPKLFFYTLSPQAFDTSLKLSLQVSHFFWFKKLKFKVSLVLFDLGSKTTIWRSKEVVLHLHRSAKPIN